MRLFGLGIGTIAATSLVWAGLASCSGPDIPAAPGPIEAGGPGSLRGLRTITLTPGDQTLVVSAQAAVADYQAIGLFDDGHREDVTGRVDFRLEDAGLGRFTGAHLVSNDYGGATDVLAEGGGVTGRASLTLLLRQRATDPGSTGLPSDPGSLFGGPIVQGRSPELVYPNDGVLVPPNLAKLEFHFRPGKGNTLFELAFSNGLTDVRVYLRCPIAMGGGCIYQPTPAVWRWIAQTNRGTMPLVVSLRGTDDRGSAVGASSPLALSFSRDNLDGALYYWTTSGQTAIMRYDFGATQTIAPERFIGPEMTDGHCVGCHALSRDGRSMAATTQNGYDGRVLLLDIGDRTARVPFGSPVKSVFESWNPESTQYVGVYAADGAISYDPMVFDGASGALLHTIDVSATRQQPTSHPDWSPDGNRIAFVRVGARWDKSDQTLARLYEGSIEMVTRNGGVWSAPRTLVPRASHENHYFPTFSPDGGFLVYDQSVCAGALGKDCNGYQDPSARLVALTLDVPGAHPVDLARANEPGPTDGGNAQLTSSFPKWSPFVFQRTGQSGQSVEWITFSSTRNYGLRQPPKGNGDESPIGTLIWMAAVDPQKAALGTADPSFPAFAVPFQDTSTSNHIAQWTTRIVIVP